MTNYILIVTVVILLCLFLNKLSSRLGIPVLLAFILLGMLFGTDGLLKISFDNYRIAEEICTVSLIFIMFYGGFGTNWKQAKPVAGKAVLLSTLGVLLTAVATGLFCYGKYADRCGFKFYRCCFGIFNSSFQTAQFKGQYCVYAGNGKRK